MTPLDIGRSAETWSAPPHRDPDDDRPRLECGVFGVFNTIEASAITALGLHALQHRGQEACGIAAFDGQRFHTERHMGYVGDAFTTLASGVLKMPNTPHSSRSVSSSSSRETGQDAVSWD